MKKKAVIFPCDYEICSLASYLDYADYDIVGLVALENANAFADNESIIPIIATADADYETFDSIIVINQKLEKSSFVEEGRRKGKNIIKIESKMGFDISDLDEIKEERRITVPIVFIAGMTLYTEKFQVQLALRKKLQENDYQVSQIGSKSYSSLFGFHPYPAFMEGNMNNEQKMVAFQKYVKYLEMKEKPDLILIGIPGGIMAVNKKHHFDFGITAFMIAQAVDADYVIMNMLYSKGYTVEQLEEIKQVCRYRLNFEIDSFHLSNTMIDPMSLMYDHLKFIEMGTRKYKNKVDGLYDFLNPDDMNEAFESMIAKLSSYNVNQIF